MRGQAAHTRDARGSAHRPRQLRRSQLSEAVAREARLLNRRRPRQGDERIAISACEQSGRCSVPDVLAPVSLQEWLAREHQGARFVLDHRGAAGMSYTTTPSDVTLLIGPEGGLSDAEVQSACAAGFQSVRLGPRVLRTETAAMVAAAHHIV